MDISIGLAFVVMLVGLVILCVQKRFNEIWGGMFLAGLIAVLLISGKVLTLSAH